MLPDKPMVIQEGGKHVFPSHGITRRVRRARAVPCARTRNEPHALQTTSAHAFIPITTIPGICAPPVDAHPRTFYYWVASKGPRREKTAGAKNAFYGKWLHRTNAERIPYQVLCALRQGGPRGQAETPRRRLLCRLWLKGKPCNPHDRLL